MKSLCFALIILTFLLTGCGNKTSDSTPADLSPATPTPMQELPSLTLSGPEGAHQILMGFKMMMESAGFGYSVMILTGADTPSGVRGLLDGTLDLLVMMRAPTVDEPVAYTEFVRTTICFFVPSTLAVDDLTSEQAVKVFAGEITNWSELGGPDQEILVVTQPGDSAITSAFSHTIMAGQAITDKAQVISDMQGVLATVRGVPGAIGYGNLYDISLFLEDSDLDIHVLTLDGLSPTDPAYPVASSVGMAYLPERTQEMQPIMDWIFDFLASNLGQQYLTRFGISVLEQQ